MPEDPPGGSQSSTKWMYKARIAQNVEPREITYTFDFEGPEPTVNQLRQAVMEKANIPDSRCNFLHMGKAIEAGEQKLSEVGLENGMCIQVVSTRLQRRPQPNTLGFPGPLPTPPAFMTNRNQRVTAHLRILRTAPFDNLDRVEESIRRILSHMNIRESGRESIQYNREGNVLNVFLPVHLRPYIASPALERQHFIEVIVSDLRHFRETALSGGLVEQVERVISGGDVSLSIEEIADMAGTFERLPEVRRITADQRDNYEETERDRRFEQFGASDNSALGFWMRHNLDRDIGNLVERLTAEQTALLPLFQLYRRVVHIERNFASQDQTVLENPNAALLIVFMEQVQRSMHRLSHAFHHLSDINIDLAEEFPRRGYPQYEEALNQQPMSGGIIRIELVDPPSGGGTPSTRETLPSEFLHNPFANYDIQQIPSNHQPVYTLNPNAMIMQQQHVVIMQAELTDPQGNTMTITDQPQIVSQGVTGAELNNLQNGGGFALDPQLFNPGGIQIEEATLTLEAVPSGEPIEEPLTLSPSETDYLERIREGVAAMTSGSSSLDNHIESSGNTEHFDFEAAFRSFVNITGTRVLPRLATHMIDRRDEEEQSQNQRPIIINLRDFLDSLLTPTDEEGDGPQQRPRTNNVLRTNVNPFSPRYDHSHSHSHSPPVHHHSHFGGHGHSHDHSHSHSHGPGHGHSHSHSPPQPHIHHHSHSHGPPSQMNSQQVPGVPVFPAHFHYHGAVPGPVPFPMIPRVPMRVNPGQMPQVVVPSPIRRPIPFIPQARTQEISVQAGSPLSERRNGSQGGVNDAARRILGQGLPGPIQQFRAQNAESQTQSNTPIPPTPENLNRVSEAIGQQMDATGQMLNWVQQRVNRVNQRRETLRQRLNQNQAARAGNPASPGPGFTPPIPVTMNQLPEAVRQQISQQLRLAAQNGNTEPTLFLIDPFMPCHSRHTGNYRQVLRGPNAYYQELAGDRIPRRTPHRAHHADYNAPFQATSESLVIQGDSAQSDFQRLIELSTRSIFGQMWENDIDVLARSSNSVNGTERDLHAFASALSNEINRNRNRPENASRLQVQNPLPFLPVPMPDRRPLLATNSAPNLNAQVETAQIQTSRTPSEIEERLERSNQTSSSSQTDGDTTSASSSSGSSGSSREASDDFASPEYKKKRTESVIKTVKSIYKERIEKERQRAERLQTIFPRSFVEIISGDLFVPRPRHTVLSSGYQLGLPSHLRVEPENVPSTSKQ